LASIRQVSFAGGEVSSTYYGRSDVPKYLTALRTCRNFFITRHGAAVSRPGTIYVADVKTASDGKVRLIPFVYSDTISYVLEFGNQYVRVHSRGIPVLNPSLGFAPVEVATPYLTADLPKLQYSQQGGVLTLTHTGYPPAELKLQSITGGAGTPTFTYTVISFDPGNPVTLASVNLTYGAFVTTGNARNWSIGVSLLIRQTSGRLVETKAVIAGQPAAEWQVSQTNPVKYTVTYNLFPNNVVALRFYRGVGDVLGFIGQASSDIGTVEFVDDGDEPDYTVSPPAGTSPFDIVNADASTFSFHNIIVGTTTHDYPAANAFFEGRRIFAGTPTRLGEVFCSKTNDYSRFDAPPILGANSPITFELASRKLEEIRSLVGLQKLLAFTNSQVWAIGGAQGTPLTFDSIDAKGQTEVGSSWVAPLVVEGSCLFVRTKGTGVRSLAFELNRQAFSSADVTVLAQHLFTTHSVVDWTYAEDPWGLVWAARDDGMLLSFTYDREEEVFAWARHDMPGGIVESLCAIPEGNEDYVYAVVNRFIGGQTRRFVERFSTRTTDVSAGSGSFFPATVATGLSLDCTSVHTASYSAGVYSVVPPARLDGERIYVVCDGQVLAGPVTCDSTSHLTLPTPPPIPPSTTPPSKAVFIGLAYTPELETLDLAIQGQEVKTKEKNLTRVGFEVDNSRGLYFGPDSDHLTEWRQRQVSDNYGAVAPGSDSYVMQVGGGWSRGGRVFLRQTAPLPVTVLSVTREVEFGDT
jgi:hypothetical protein